MMVMMVVILFLIVLKLKCLLIFHGLLISKLYSTEQFVLLRYNM